MSGKDGTKARPRPQPAETLGPDEIVRLGECVYALAKQLQGTSLPLPPVVKAAPFFQQALASDQPPDFRHFGEGMRDLHVRQGGYGYRLTLAQGKLFWEALNGIVYLLSLGQELRPHREAALLRPQILEVRAITLEEIAEQIIDDAFADTDELPPSPQEQLARVRFALALDRGCSDAYLIQGTVDERNERYQDAKAAYEQAMRLAAERLGFDAFIQKKGEAKTLHFWVDIQTRSYMRARAALAYLLWRRLGQLGEAIAHFQALLDLNPNDNQGNRDALLCCLLEAGDDAALAEALARHRYYTDETGHKEEIAGTEWHYTNAVWLFRTQQDADGLQKAVQALKQAFKRNRYVPLFLIEPEDLPDLDELSAYSFGDSTEAAMYVAQAMKGWRNTPGALAWLEEIARQSKLYPMTDGIPPIHVVSART